MKRLTALLGVTLLLVLGSQTSVARDQINIVGSSTVYPFATVVAERFGKTTKYKTPKIESTGSGGGLKLFCDGTGIRTPDITNSSRRIKQGEVDNCRNNGVTEIIETKFGYDGIVIANAKSVSRLTISLKHIFLALAKQVPNPDGSETFIANPYQKWSDLDPKLPAKKIEVLGPPPTSGTRDAFVELAMEGGCKTFAWIKAMKKVNKKQYKSYCHAIREDGHYIEAGENDNLIVQKLRANKNAYGIFGYSFLDQNHDKVHGAIVGGNPPSFEAIASGAYPISRALYFYTKKAHIGVVPGIERFLKEFIAKRTAGPDGYLVDKGMIPLSADELRKQTNTIKNLTPLGPKL